MIYTLGMADWKYVIYNIPFDTFNHHTAKVVFTDDEDDARRTFTEMNEKGMDRFILMALVSPEVAGLNETLYAFAMGCEIEYDGEIRLILKKVKKDGTPAQNLRVFYHPEYGDKVEKIE